MSADVVCMSLANVPPGEQRSRFLAVGLVDNTVRIISLDPSVCCLSHLSASCSGQLRLFPSVQTVYYLSVNYIVVDCLVFFSFSLCYTMCILSAVTLRWGSKDWIAL